jgi:diguanylate cyclase (GGDEF)-like protein/PAS domain S-box-containing protein
VTPKAIGAAFENTVVSIGAGGKNEITPAMHLISDRDQQLLILNNYTLFVQVDSNGRICNASNKLCDISGLSRGELLGRDYRAFSSDFFSSGSLEIEQAMASGIVWRSDLCVRTKTGAVLWVDITLTPWRDADGRTGYLALGLDITHRKETEEALRRSEARYRSTMMALGEGIVILDADGCITSANPAAERILNLSLDESRNPIATDLRWDTIREDGRPFPSHDYPAMITLATGEPQRNVVMGVRGDDNRVTWISINSEPIFENGSAKPTSVVTSFSDITARKQAQEVLSEAIAVIADGFAVYDESDRLLMCNEAYRAVYERSTEAFQPGNRFESILRHGLVRGQYPEAGNTTEQQEIWLEERLRQHRLPSSSSLQELPDGRWVQVREQRTPSGYTVGSRIDVSEIKRQSAMLQAVVGNFPGGIAYFDRSLNLAFCNHQYRVLLALPDELFANGSPTLEMIFRSNAVRGEYGPGDPEEQVRGRLDLALKFEAHIYERTRPDGTVIEIRGAPVPDGGFITTVVDVSARRAAERLLVESERRARETTATLQITLAHMSQGLTMFDADGRLEVWNDRFVDMYGLPPDAVTRGVSLTAILASCRKLEGSESSADEFLPELRREIGRGRTFTSTWRLSDGRTIAMVHTPITGGGWVSTHEDITEREQAARQISHLAHHDVLTGLANRAHFKARVEAALARAARRGDSISVLVIDLDRFKPVNDTLGHAAGDKLLQAVAERMCRQVRAGDVVARLGGDEFAVLQDNEPDQREGAIALASRLVDVIGDAYELEGRQVNIGASIGIAIAPESGTNVSQLLRAADVALYKVKGAGRNAYRIYDEGLESESHNRCRLENDLRQAIMTGALELHYQPIVSVADESICSMEALVRWRHPSRGLVMPDQFIPLAEETGLIVPLGEWVMRQACLDAMDWPDHVKLAVNLSPIHIKKRTVVDGVTRAMLETKLHPQRLEIEVTETVLLQHDNDILDELHQLRGLGVSVVLDDFGTGYSSLSHLRMFAFDKIKIDRQFVAEITERPDCAAIVCAVTGLARSLDMVTTAEGVETEEQARLVRAAGCTEAQGYLFGKPRPLAEIEFAAMSQRPATRQLSPKR